MTDQKLLIVHTILAALLVLLASLVTPAHAQAQAPAFENLDRLDSLVAMSVGANRGEPGGPVTAIDRRLRLAPCPQTPTVDAALPNVATVSCQSIGWRIRVPLLPGAQAGQAVSASQMAPRSLAFRASAAPSQAAVVRKGDPVQLIAGNEDFQISRMMVADEDGALGALIRVRQDPKATPVFARVEAIGVVRIPGI